MILAWRKVGKLVGYFLQRRDGTQRRIGSKLQAAGVVGGDHRGALLGKLQQRSDVFLRGRKLLGNVVTDTLHFSNDLGDAARQIQIKRGSNGRYRWNGVYQPGSGAFKLASLSQSRDVAASRICSVS